MSENDSLSEQKIMHLWHGSENIIERPVFGAGRIHNDYGRGFYCTESKDLAMEWAVNFERDGFANGYDLDFKGLSVLDLNSSEFCILHWLTILLKNREFDSPSILASDAKEYLTENFSIDYESSDLIIGYRADDSYFSFAQDFLNGTISYRQLNNAMHLGKLGQQIVLKSERSFDRIRFTGFEEAKSEEWFERKNKRDKEARNGYFNSEKNKRMRDDIYITQILNEEMKADDFRTQ